MSDHHEPTTQAGGLELAGVLHYLGEGLLPACGSGEGGFGATPVVADVTCEACRELDLEALDAGLVLELLEQGPPTAIERRFAELRDPDGATFVSPLGDRRERPVLCRSCRRIETYALRAVCVPCLERDLFAEVRDEALAVLQGREVKPFVGIADALDEPEAGAFLRPDEEGCSSSCDWCNLTGLPHRATR